MAKQKRKVGAGGKPPKKEPADYSGWLKRARELVGSCHIAQCHDRAHAAAGLSHRSQYRQCFDEARAAFDRAIALRPDSAEAWLEKGRFLIELESGHEAQARGALLQAARLDPGNARAWMWLGAVESQQGDWVAAREHLDMAVSLDPEMRRKAEEEYDIPAELREPFFAGAPSVGLFRTRAGRTPDERCREAAQLRQNWQQGGNAQKAEEIYRDAIRCNPDSWMAHFGLGEVLLFNAADAGQWSGAVVEEGIGHLKEAATLAPKRIEPLLKLANKLSVCDPPVKDMVAARGYYRQAIDALSEEQEFLYPEVWQGGDHWEFACESAKIGDTDIAVTAFAHAIRMNPTLYRTKFRPPDAAGVQCWLRAMERSG
jgi:tetratricopeptide (TPR) repeat protein